MTGNGSHSYRSDDRGSERRTRRQSPQVTATIRTTHDDSALIAASISPDNTLEMETVAMDDAVRTQITRDTTGGAQATVDDYVVNLIVASTVAQHANQPTGRDAPGASTDDTQQS